MDPILTILSVLGYWAIILGSFGGPGRSYELSKPTGGLLKTFYWPPYLVKNSLNLLFLGGWGTEIWSLRGKPVAYKASFNRDSNRACLFVVLEVGGSLHVGANWNRSHLQAALSSP